MRNNFKRLGAMLMALIMVFTMLPVSVLAADGPTVTVNTAAITDGTVVDTSVPAQSAVLTTLTGELAVGTVFYVPVMLSGMTEFNAFDFKFECGEALQYIGSVTGFKYDFMGLGVEQFAGQSLTYGVGEFADNPTASKVGYMTANGIPNNGTKPIFYAGFKVIAQSATGAESITIQGADEMGKPGISMTGVTADDISYITTGSVSVEKAPSSGDEGDEPETNTGYQVYYQITGADTEPDNFVEINPGATFEVGVYVKSTDSTTKKMQAFDIYPTWDTTVLSCNGVAAAEAGEIVVTEMSKTTPHFYSVAKDLNKSVDANGVKVATMTMTLGENAVYNTGYKVGLSNKTNMAVELNAESVPVTVDTTEKGAETLKKVKVNFNTNGGSTVAEQEIGYNTTATKPTTNPSKTGYEFVDWYKEAACTNVFDFSAKLTADVTTVYAKWIENTVEVTLNANGGKFGDDSTDKTVSETFDGTYEKTLAEKPEREGYTFAGWYDEATGGNKIETTTKVEKADEHTLYAQWTPYTYTIKFDLNGVTGTTPNDIPATYDAEYPLPTMNIEGYTFGGWTLNDVVVASPAKNLTNVNNAIVTLVAKWTMNPYTIQTSATNGTVSALNAKDDSASANVGDTINVEVTPNAGYKIDNVFYYLTADAANENKTTYPITVGADGKGTFTMPAANVTVSATFTAIPYNVTIDAGITHGTVTIIGQTTAVAGEIVKLNVTADEGYEDVRVFYVKDGETVENKISITDGKYSFTMPAANVTVKAVFEGITSVVTLNPNGGTFAQGAATTINATYDGTYSELANAPVPTRVGYTFAGWYDAATGGNKITVNTQVKEYVAHTLFAQWTANTYTITFVTNGGSFGDNSGVVDNKMTYTYGDAAAKLPAIDKALHNFLNWTVSYDEGVTEGWGAAGATIAGESAIGDKYNNVTLTANWEAAFVYEVEDYKYAPADYVMLRIATDSNTNAYAFDGAAMFYTADENYKLNDKPVFVTLIPKTGNVESSNRTLTTTALDKISQTGAAADVIARDGKVNNDDIVNIADANAVYQMVVATGSYYSLTQLEILNRLEADMDTAPTTGDNEFRGSILDVHKIVDIINENANPTTTG